jgi:glucose-6-phosphate isomerase, archaeal
VIEPASYEVVDDLRLKRGDYREVTALDLRDIFLEQPDLDERPLVIYSTSAVRPADDRDELLISLTNLRPGTVGGEFYMTRGHRHAHRAGEMYLFLAGEGGVLCQAGREVRWVPATAGQIVHIPAGWAHRTINTGGTSLVFIAFVSATAGHDYDTVKSEGMGARVTDTDAGTMAIVVADGYRLTEH